MAKIDRYKLREIRQACRVEKWKYRQTLRSLFSPSELSELLGEIQSAVAWRYKENDFKGPSRSARISRLEEICHCDQWPARKTLASMFSPQELGEIIDEVIACRQIRDSKRRELHSDIYESMEQSGLSALDGP